MLRRQFAVATVAVAMAVLSSVDAETPVTLAGAPPELPPNVDVRATGAVPRAQSRDMVSQVGATSRTRPGTLGLGPRLLWSEGDGLTPASSSDPEHVVRRFLTEQRALYGVAPGIESGLIERSRHVQHGVTILRFDQRIRGIEVFHGEIKAAIDQQGRLRALNGEVVPDPGPLSPRISAAVALRTALEEFDGLAPPAPARVIGPTGADRSTRFDRASFVYAPSARLVVFPMPSETRLGWAVELPISVRAWYDVVVDAESAEILFRANRAIASGPEGEVFVTNADPDDGPPEIVPFAGALPAPRDEWLPSGGTTTSGNNVVAGEDRDGTACLSAPLYCVAPASALDQHFDFGFANDYELAGNALTDIPAAVTNVFYWTNFLHDHFYSLGFSETAGNFQSDNFGAGGLGADPVVGLVQFGADSCPLVQTCFNNAFFLTLDDGLPSFMAMLLLTDPPFERVDGAFAADVIIHEFTHGVSNRLVGVGTLGGIQSGALGEAWGDWFAASITQDPVLAEYWNDDLVTGIRFFALDANPATYGDVCTIGYSACEVHKEGEIWSATLWDIRTALVSQYGAVAGRAAAEQLVVDAMMLTPPDPTFLDARDAMLQADALGAGAERCLLWSAFASRGMGESALSFGDTGDVVEAFDEPIDCAYPGPDGDGDGMPDAYETLHSCLNPAQMDGTNDAEPDGLLNIDEMNGASDPCAADTDGDAFMDGVDSCPLLASADQTNMDSGPAPPAGRIGQVGNGRFGGTAAVDVTVPGGDALGDVCDPNDDNDYQSDAFDLEPAGDYTYDDDNDGQPAAGCLGGTDTDAGEDGPSWDAVCDGRRDGLSAAYCAALSPSLDADGDRVPERAEVCKWSTSDSDTDSDGDGLTDCLEIIDVNGDSSKAFLTDLLPYAKAVQLPAAAFGKDGDFDYNGDNAFAFLADLLPVAKLIQLPPSAGGCDPLPAAPNP